MDNNLYHVVLDSYKEVLESNGLEITPDLNNKVGRESGLNSLGIVQFVIGIEERFGMNFDPILADIRKCSTVKDIADLIGKFTAEQK
jgi:acyl carrier protein